jgi:hypothetical protein
VIINCKYIARISLPATVLEGGTVMGKLGEGRLGEGRLGEGRLGAGTEQLDTMGQKRKKELGEQKVGVLVRTVAGVLVRTVAHKAVQGQGQEEVLLDSIRRSASMTQREQEANV